MAKQATAQPAEITRPDLLAYLAGQLTELSETTKIAITDDRPTFQYVLHQAFEHGKDPTVVKTLAIYYALRRFRAYFINEGKDLPTDLESRIAAAKAEANALPFDPPISV